MGLKQDLVVQMNGGMVSIVFFLNWVHILNLQEGIDPSRIFRGCGRGGGSKFLPMFCWRATPPHLLELAAMLACPRSSTKHGRKEVNMICEPIVCEPIIHEPICENRFMFVDLFVNQFCCCPFVEELKKCEPIL